ncbi:MAG: hypothetical protein SV422_03935, partial [Pseudomonadota bacterium]|nr:hypothetical protein [Pseudomonadota bacterium]
ACDDVFVSLLFFNVGVEAGQVLFILAVVALVGLLHRAAAGSGSATAITKRATADRPIAVPAAANQHRMELLAAYVIGVPSAYWLIERVAGFL